MVESVTRYRAIHEPRYYTYRGGPPGGPATHSIEADTQESSGPIVPVEYLNSQECDVLDQGLWTPGYVRGVQNGDVRVEIMRKYWFDPDADGKFPHGTFYLARRSIYVKNHDVKNRIRYPITYKKFDDVEVHGVSSWLRGTIMNRSTTLTRIVWNDPQDYLDVDLDCFEVTTEDDITLTNEQMRNIVRKYDPGHIEPETHKGALYHKNKAPGYGPEELTNKNTSATAARAGPIFMSAFPYDLSTLPDRAGYNNPYAVVVRTTPSGRPRPRRGRGGGSRC